MADLILDIGVHRGDDTDFYLKKGFDVVAVDADPRHIESCRVRFAGAIAEGRLTLVHAAIAPRVGQTQFYINLDKDDWSSLSKRLGTRRRSRHQVIDVAATTMPELLREHARDRRVHYIKADIEGGDIHVLEGLNDYPRRPRFLSVEAQHLVWLSQMFLLGYRRFKLVNQNLVWTQRPPTPAREGQYAEHTFTEHSSGLFGEESPGEWGMFEDVAESYLVLRRMQIGNPTLSNAYYDFHAKRA